MAIENGKYLIYRHIRPDKDEPFYIGVSKMGTSRYKETRRRNSIWQNIVDKNNGKYEVEVLLDDLSLVEADIKEIEFIDLYGRIKYNTGILANILRGGRGTKEYKVEWSNESREVARQTAKSKVNTAKNREKTPEEREAISIRMKGHRPYNYPGTMTAEGKIKHIARITGNHYAKNSGVHIGNTYSVDRMHITDGINNQFIMNNESIPEGWKRGRTLHYKDPTKKGRPKKISSQSSHNN